MAVHVLCIVAPGREQASIPVRRDPAKECRKGFGVGAGCSVRGGRAAGRRPCRKKGPRNVVCCRRLHELRRDTRHHWKRRRHSRHAGWASRAIRRRRRRGAELRHHSQQTWKRPSMSCCVKPASLASFGVEQKPGSLGTRHPLACCRARGHARPAALGTLTSRADTSAESRLPTRERSTMRGCRRTRIYGFRVFYSVPGALLTVCVRLRDVCEHNFFCLHLGKTTLKTIS